MVCCGISLRRDSLLCCLSAGTCFRRWGLSLLEAETCHIEAQLALDIGILHTLHIGLVAQGILGLIDGNCICGIVDVLLQVRKILLPDFRV